MSRSKIVRIGLILSLSFQRIGVFAQTNRGATNVKVKKDNGQTGEVKLQDGSYALVIGVSD